MPVDEQNFLETVIRDAFGNVRAEGYPHLRLNMDCAGKVDVVQIQPVGNRREHEHAIRRTPPDFQTDRLREKQIDIKWQVPPVLLGTASRQEHDFLHTDRVIHLRPGQPVVPILHCRACPTRIHETTPRYSIHSSLARCAASYHDHRDKRVNAHKLSMFVQLVYY